MALWVLAVSGWAATKGGEELGGPGRSVERRIAALCRGTVDALSCVDVLRSAWVDDRAGAGPELLENEVDAVLGSAPRTRRRERAAVSLLAREGWA